MTGSLPAQPAAALSSAPARLRAHDAARRHSARVQFLKVAIPAGAILGTGLVLLLTMFNPFARIPGLVMGGISISGTKIAMQSPKLTGYRKDSRPYEVTANAAYQDVRNPGIIELKDMRATLRLDAAGTTADLVSNAGLFDTAKEHLDLSRDIRITTSRGEEILLKSASIDMKAGTASSREPVRITSRGGTIEAEGIDISDSGGTVRFTGRVRTQFERVLPAPDPAAPRVSQADTTR